MRVAASEAQFLQGLRRAETAGAGVVGRVAALDAVELCGELVHLDGEVFVDGEDMTVDGD